MASNSSRWKLDALAAPSSLPGATRGADGGKPAARVDDDQTPQAETRRLWRVWLVVVVLAGLGLVVSAQLVRFHLFALPARTIPVTTPAQQRGLIVDSGGTPLVVNRTFFQLAATASNIKDDAQRHEVAQQLEELLGVPAARTFDKLTGAAPFQYVVLVEAVSAEDVTRLDALKQQLETELLNRERTTLPLRQVYAEPRARRHYPQAELTSHVLGFEHPYTGGVNGVEEFYDDFLLKGVGLLSDRALPVSALAADVQRFLPSAVGNDLILSLDSTVQWIIREELQRGLAEFDAIAGTVVVLEPHTGAVLGMVNLPDFDPNRWEVEDGRLTPNMAVSGQYEPGSVFKIITMAAALDAEILEPTTVYTDTGYIQVGGRQIYNSTRMSHGAVTVTEALAQSLNVVTAQIALDLDTERFYRYVQRFGFGEPTNVDLSGEISGLVKTPKNRDWSLSDLGTNSFGQGLAVTPIQMANATAVIANGGMLMRPYIVEARIKGDRVQLSEPVMVRQVLRPEVAAEMAQMMADITEMGNSKAAVPGYRVAGKSGTAQIPDLQNGGYIRDATIVTFVGFAPADAPRFVILVKMDRPDPNINQWASHTAAPVFSRIAARLLDYLNVPPDEIRLAGMAPAGAP